jgi:hypothetical protein
MEGAALSRSGPPSCILGRTLHLERAWAGPEKQTEARARTSKKRRAGFFGSLLFVLSIV